ncbi:hypothetical protein HZA57_01070 [Candidatus Poribacteria bacterium]|nr:hypothetical protein [Candidatus Poribacteria bacterium]
MKDNRPPRDELFGFYYLGFAPDGTYKYPNANQLAAHYRVSSDAVLRWLGEYGLDPATVGRRSIELSRCSVDIQLEMPNLTPEGVRRRIAEVLADFDEAAVSRRPWLDGPIQ